MISYGLNGFSGFNPLNPFNPWLITSLCMSDQLPTVRFLEYRWEPEQTCRPAAYRIPARPGARTEVSRKISDLASRETKRRRQVEPRRGQPPADFSRPPA